MRRTTRFVAPLLGALVTMALVPRAAQAQMDVTPPLPNVLILLDTSGSMERFPNGTLPTVAMGKTSTEKNRWVQALEVLGGTITGYQMLGVTRDATPGSDFFNEYNLNSAPPYDGGFYLPHFRPISKVGATSCTIGASSLTTTKSWPTDWTTWGVSNFGFRAWNGSSLGAVGSCIPSDFDTDHLGILDTFRDQARFGLMTFDTSPDPKTGWTGSAQNGPEGMTGQWSYYPAWNKSPGVNPTFGWPTGCKVDATTKADHAFELGARNPSAPPWEGPLVGFAANDSSTALRAVNDRIRWAMLAARPYGATPLGPMLADAKWYLQSDPDGPASDTSSSCRGTFIIVITDGFPNSDLRPNCEDPTSSKSPPTMVYNDPLTGCSDLTKGCCPSKRPQDITYDLWNNPPPGKPKVETFVVGFAVSDDTGKDVKCDTIDPASGICATMAKTDPQYPCCTLHEMAFNGGSGKALFANDTESLRAQLINAMSAATAKTSTSRTMPVFTQSTSSSTSNGQAEFRSSFKVSAFSAWYGVLERVRWVCQNVSGVLTPVEQAVDKTQGDDFAWNLNKQATRRFISIDPSSIPNAADATLRPNLASGEADLMAPTAAPVVDANGSTFVSTMTAAALKITTGCGADATTADDCKTKLLNYALALPQPKVTMATRVGNALADMYHATPDSVAPPNEFLRDESYTQFHNANLTRIPMLLAATNDGILHAFRTDVKAESDAVELWGFIPPAVLPSIGKQYGGAHALLLDAAPVVKDVAFGLAGSTTPWGRTSANAKGGQGNWRTVAVGGLTVGRGYYALDITDPAKPQMLWQLTRVKDSSGTDYEMFGSTPGVPAIGTVFYTDGVNPATETPVAFLPGGDGTINKTGTCARWLTPTGTTDVPTTPRSKTRCWVGAGTSMTIVRLYDGKILRTFRNDPAGLAPDHPAEPNNAATAFKSTGKSSIVVGNTGYANIDAPITGAVALYPGNTGTVTTRAFVGDADGDVWKIDVSAQKPDDWTFSLFHDAYFPGEPTNTNPATWSGVNVAPVLSVDPFGDIVVIYATGDQNTFSTTNVNHVYSLTERSSGFGSSRTTTTKLNWHIQLSKDGVTPTGPLSLFNSQLFFSTFSPGVTTSDVCSKGQATIWGVDYLATEGSAATNPDGTLLPAAKFEDKTSADDALAGVPCPSNITNKASAVKFFRCISLDAPSITFGAGITQRPTCIDTTAAVGVDPYLGTSSPHASVSAVTPGQFQLVAQTGPKTGTTNSAGSTTNVYVHNLPVPSAVTRIDSWAAIIE